MMIFPVVGILALAGLLISEKNHDKRPKWICRPLTSLMFVLTGVWLADSSARYDVLIMVGLVLGMAGDVLLIPDGKKWFMLGLVTFLLGHLLYVGAFFDITTGYQFNVIGLLFVPIGVLVYILLEPTLGSMKIPVLVYIVVITAMVRAALGVYFDSDEPQTFRRLVALGALCFYASDLAVALDRFVKPRFKQAFWGLPLYYGGQFLLAYSIAENA